MPIHRHWVLVSLALHVVGLLGIVVLSRVVRPVMSLGGMPGRIDMRFATRPPGPPGSSGSRSVSRETPKPKPAPEKKEVVAAEKVKSPPAPNPTPKSAAQSEAKPKPKSTPAPKSTPKPNSAKKTIAAKPKETPKPKENSKQRIETAAKADRPEPRREETQEEPAEERSAPPQPTRTYYPQPRSEESSDAGSDSHTGGSGEGRHSPKAGGGGTGGPVTPGGGSQGGALIGVRGGGPSLPDYYSRQAIASIAANFKVPPDQESDALCQIAFYILADGRITEPRILRTSGTTALDGLALEALKQTTRLAPLPDEIRAQAIEAQLTFSFRSASGE